MTRSLYSAPCPAPSFARNRRISPRQAEMLESLWDARLRREARRPRPARSREERFRHIAETVGRKVETAGELSWREANRVLRRLLEEVRSSSASRADNDPAGHSTLDMPSASRKPIARRSRKTSRTPASGPSSAPRSGPITGKNACRSTSKTRKGGRPRHD